ncbi:hypothetical protein BATDEDRAFT_22812 [Batrachochytrium dendrobatidis JAM81]|uniref:RRM domain-containing protein n=1 Tax=Batrachochytrium dendrobatidis (strain JAM81 / FGSC 10211) TaxID=684364 RepID=F4NVV2_BATDJ|nr:uncharacterized protein BATDEDRAFT_22812 [Batrachochytrium dendrobatidis JAM81]EGF82371.1 hypothetical protein BATDEDRAFT_22812 [Batrachochytrium dendrobatidis JAM81]|eukprot:XP_006676633.1 hypothetical protein BATDEDRAFT_22812 [Batrachochytrium dendrobatidis JAM81]
MDKEQVYGSPGADSDDGLHIQGTSESNHSVSRSPADYIKGESGSNRSSSRNDENRGSPKINEPRAHPGEFKRSPSNSSPPRYISNNAPLDRSPVRGKGKDDRDSKALSTDPSTVVGAFGLSLFTTELELRGLFSPFGKITHCTIIRDALTLRSRGFGFITFDTIDSAVKAQQELNGTVLNNRTMRVARLDLTYMFGNTLDFSISSRPHEPTPGFYKGISTRESSSEGRQHREPRPHYNPYPERRDMRRDMVDRGRRSQPYFRPRSRSPPSSYRGSHEGYHDGWADRGDRYMDRRIDYERQERGGMGYGPSGGERGDHRGDFGRGDPYRSRSSMAAPPLPPPSDRYRGGYSESRSRSPVYDHRQRR